MVLQPMLRHSGVCIKTRLVQQSQLIQRHLEVVPNHSSHVPLSRREDPDRVFVSREQFVTPLAIHAGSS
jgi:hypothetical protein